MNLPLLTALGLLLRGSFSFLLSYISPQKLYFIQSFFGNCDRNTRGVKKHDIKKKGRSVLKTCRSDIKGTRLDKQVQYLRIGAVNCTEMQRGKQKRERDEGEGEEITTFRLGSIHSSLP